MCFHYVKVKFQFVKQLATKVPFSYITKSFFEDVGAEENRLNSGVAAVETGGNQMSTGHLHLEWFDSPVIK